MSYAGKLSDLPEGWQVENPPYMDEENRYWVRNKTGRVVARAATLRAAIKAALRNTTLPSAPIAEYKTRKFADNRLLGPGLSLSDS